MYCNCYLKKVAPEIIGTKSHLQEKDASIRVQHKHFSEAPIRKCSPRTQPQDAHEHQPPDEHVRYNGMLSRG